MRERVHKTFGNIVIIIRVACLYENPVHKNTLTHASTNTNTISYNIVCYYLNEIFAHYN